MAVSLELERLRRKRYRERHRERINMEQKIYRKSNPHKVDKKLKRSQVLLRNYGLTDETHAEILASQNNVCGVCKQPKTSTRDWDVDHCHNTNIVRGLLCRQCNLMLGYAKDNIETLLEGAKYLGKFKTQST